MVDLLSAEAVEVAEQPLGYWSGLAQPSTRFARVLTPAQLVAMAATRPCLMRGHNVFSLSLLYGSHCDCFHYS